MLKSCKGHLISKCPFSVFKSFKKPTKFFSRISALKVRQIRNDFFKLTFLPINEGTNSTLLCVELFVFWKKVKTPKKTFRN